MDHAIRDQGATGPRTPRPASNVFKTRLYPLHPRFPLKERVDAVRLDPRLLLASLRIHVNCNDDGHPPQPDVVRITARLAVSKRVDVIVRLEHSPVVQNELHVVHVVKDDVRVRGWVVAPHIWRNRALNRLRERRASK